MGNPTTHVSDALFAAWTKADPVRYAYDGGLWLEEGTTNYITEPSAETTIAEWGNVGSGVRSKVTTEHYDGVSGIQVVANADFAGVQVQTPAGLTWTEGEKVALSAFAKGPGGNFRVRATLINGDASSGNTDLINPHMFNGGWNRVSGIATVAAGKTLSRAQLIVFRNSGNVGDITFFEDMAQVERKGYVTSPCHGGMGAGYAWQAVEHGSISTRAASSASISPTGILNPVSGALAFRITPTIETGLEELWGEAGVKGAATDHVRWGRDASKHPFVEWSSNDAAYQRLTASETIDAGTETFLYVGHAGTTTSLQVDAGTLQTGSRAAVSASFGAGPLKLQATAGGNIVSPFATFNRTLTAKEIATLNGKNNWTMKVLAGNPYRNFQLRPY